MLISFHAALCRYIYAIRITSLNSTLDLGDQSSSTNQTDSPSNVTSAQVSTIKEESVLLPLRDNANTAILWSPDSDEPPPTAVAARRFYWRMNFIPIRNRQEMNTGLIRLCPLSKVLDKSILPRRWPSSSVRPTRTYYPHQYAAIRSSRLQLYKRTSRSTFFSVWPIAKAANYKRSITTIRGAFRNMAPSRLL